MNLIIDNYDSFSYNVYQLAGSIDPDIRVVRNDELTVDGLDRVHIDNAHGYALLPEHFGGLYCLMHQQTAGNNGAIAAVTDYRALAKLKPCILGVEVGINIAGQAQVHRAVVFDRVLCRPAGGVSVGGDDDLHIGKCSHNRYILGGMVACTVECITHSAVCAAEFDIEVCVAYLVACRQQTQRGEKHGEGIYKGDLADGGHTGGGCNHILLCDAHVEEAFGVRLAENRALGRAGKVGVEYNDVFINVAQLCQNSAVDLSYCFRHLLHLRVLP